MSSYDKNFETRRLVYREDCGEIPVVVFDIDEVLWNVNHSYIAEVNRFTGKSFTVEDITCYDMAQALGVCRTVIDRVFHETDAANQIQACTYSRDLVEGIRDGSLCPHFNLPEVPHRVAFVTHRGFRANGLLETADLLHQNNLIPDELVAAPLRIPKLDLCDELYGERLQMIFEDHPTTLNDFIMAGFPAVRSLRPWNRSQWSELTIDLNVSATPLQL